MLKSIRDLDSDIDAPESFDMTDHTFRCAITEIEAMQRRCAGRMEKFLVDDEDFAVFSIGADLKELDLRLRQTLEPLGMTVELYTRYELDPDSDSDLTGITLRRL